MTEDTHSTTNLLAQNLHRARCRLRSRSAATWTASVWAFQAYVMWLIADSLSFPLSPTSLGLILLASISLATATSMLIRIWCSKRFETDMAVAKVIESHFPEIDSRLFALTQSQTAHTKSKSHFLLGELERELLSKCQPQNWKHIVSSPTLLASRLASVISFGLIVVVSVAISRAPFGSLPLQADSETKTLASLESSPESWQVIPGNTEIEKGQSLLVTVKLPVAVTEALHLVSEDADGNFSRYRLEQSLADPIYSGQIPSVRQDLQYRIETADNSTPSFQVAVYELPELQELSIKLDYPEFTGLTTKALLDPRRLQAVEGTELRMSAKFNQPLRSAIWQGPSGEYVMKPTDEENRYEMTVPLRESERWQLRFESVTGRQPASPTSLKLTALPNQPSEVRWLAPGFDPQVSPIEEVDVLGTATDDFGVINLGLTFQLAGKPPIERMLRKAASSSEEASPRTLEAEIREQIAMESLDAQPGDLMQMFLWAEDLIEGNQIRRTLGDLLVAEVRDFEQIFRQSDQPDNPNQPSPQSEQSPGEPNEQEAQDLIERQKQILLATWNLLRRGINSENWQSDVELVLDEQLAIIEEARPKLEEIPEADLPPDRRLKLEQAMLTATEQILSASKENRAAPLQDATVAQQVILQELTRLVGNEFDVQQQQGQQGQQSSPSSNRQAGSPRQQQLQQLQLDNDRNRYEQESQAQDLTSPQQQQERDQLNRLTDLAQRQEDLNEQIRQLQAALEAVEDEDQAEELQRRLERLREEQEQLLRDTERLEEDLTNDPDGNREDRQQLEQARESAQQTAQALSEENVEQALAEGRRAEQALDELKEDFQQRTGESFQEGLRQLNEQLQRLSQSQQDVEEQLQTFFDDESGDLRERDRTTPLLDEMQDREEQLDQALEDLREMVEASEDSEPLLSDELYEAFREAKQQQVDLLADESRRWIENGLPERSVPIEEALSERLETLQQAVERSSQLAGIDDLSRLRVAEATVRELAAEANPRDTPSEPEGNNGDRDPEERDPEERDPEEIANENPNQQESQGQESQGQESQGQESQGQNPQGQNPMGESASRTPPTNSSPGGDPMRGDANASSAESLLDQWSEYSAAGGNPLVTDSYRGWMDRFRELENLVPAGPLAEEATRIRQRAEALRRDFQRHSKNPDPEEIDELIVKPLSNLARRISAERIRLEGTDESIRLDKDPVPSEFAEEVREYFQRLGAGEK